MKVDIRKFDMPYELYVDLCKMYEIVINYSDAHFSVNLNTQIQINS